MISIKNISRRMTMGCLLLTLFLAKSLGSSAEVKLFMEDFAIANGETKEVSLMLTNDKEATVLQAEIALPAGLTYVDGSACKTDRVKGRGTTVQASTATGKLVIVETDGTIAAGDGAVITFQLTRSGGLLDGDYVVPITDIVVSDTDANQLNTQEQTTVNVKALGLDDCVFAVVEESAEVNVGEEYQVDITLTNEGVTNLSALQGKLTLPDGLQIVDGEDGKFIYADRTPSPLEFKFQEYEGYTTFLLSSSSNKLITGTDGVIFSFKVKSDAPLESTIKLEDLRVGAVTGQSALLDDVVINIKVKQTYIPGDVNGDGEVNEVDAQQILDVAVGLKKVEDLTIPSAISVPGGNDEALEVNAQLVLDYAVATVKPW